VAGMNLYTKFKSQFKPARVRKHSKDWTRGFLSRVGAFVMRSARSSIRKAKKVAEPGNPPHAHGKRSPLRYGIFFAVEPYNVVIGPVRLDRAKRRDRSYVTSDKTGPQLLEEGGTAVLHPGRGSKRRAKRMRYRKFPYMKPAFDKGLADFKRKTGKDANRWAKSVR